MKAIVAGEGQGELIGDGVCAEGELVALWLSGGVEINELEVIEGELHAVLEDGLSVDDIIIESGPGAVACSGDGVELVGMVDAVEMGDEVFCFAVGNGGVIRAVDDEDGGIPGVHERVGSIHGAPEVNDDSGFRVRTDGGGFLRGCIEGGYGASGTPADPNTRGVDVVGGGVLAEPANGLGGVLGGGIDGSKEGAEIGGGAGFIGGVIAYEPVLDGGADVAPLGEGFAKVADCNGFFIPRDEPTTMNDDHDGALFGEVYSSGFVNI